MQADQLPLFEEGTSRPQGLDYRPEFLSLQEEQALAAELGALPFRPFEFHGFLGKRRTVSFGWHYAFDGSGLAEADPIPAFLLPLRERAAEFAGIPADTLAHALVTEYAPGAGIGWHRDRSVFGRTVGVSLLSDCRLRFRRRDRSGWQRASLMAEARSIYLLNGASRTDWEHSIAPVDRLRYSITLRTFADARIPK